MYSERAVSLSASSPNPVITSTGRSGYWILITLRILRPSMSGMKMSVTRKSYATPFPRAAFSSWIAEMPSGQAMTP